MVVRFYACDRVLVVVVVVGGGGGGGGVVAVVDFYPIIEVDIFRFSGSRIMSYIKVLATQDGRMGGRTDGRTRLIT